MQIFVAGISYRHGDCVVTGEEYVMLLVEEMLVQLYHIHNDGVQYWVHDRSHNKATSDKSYGIFIFTVSYWHNELLFLSV